MARATIYGIRNCDTMKKAFAFLDAHKVDYVFHDYKKQGADKDVLARAIKTHGWENVLNRKGTTWRGLDEKLKADIDDAAALKLALDNPSVIRRPLLVTGKSVTLGFDEAEYKKLFS